jgi:hypothetical protein
MNSLNQILCLLAKRFKYINKCKVRLIRSVPITDSDTKPLSCPTVSDFVTLYQFHFRHGTRQSWSFTQATAQQMFHTVQGNTFAKIYPALECSVVNIIHKWMLFSMSDLMGINGTLITKWLITHITDIRTLSSMDTLMYIQTTLIGKELSHTLQK